MGFDHVKVTNPIPQGVHRRVPESLSVFYSGGSNVARVFCMGVPKTGEAKFPMTPITILLNAHTYSLIVFQVTPAENVWLSRSKSARSQVSAAHRRYAGFSPASK